MNEISVSIDEITMNISYITTSFNETSIKDNEITTHIIEIRIKMM